MKNIIFQNKKFNTKKALKYGFVKDKTGYLYKVGILDNQFTLYVNISNNDVKTKLIEVSTNEIYTLHLISGVEGNFVGQVKEAYENILYSIAQNCFDISVFTSEQTFQVIDYIKEKYGDNPEYLWDKFPNNAITRNKDTKKWYTAILTVRGDKIGLQSEKEVEIIDLHAKVEDIPLLTAKPNIYQGYHMNKKHWFTIVLNNSVKFEEICKYIDESYNLSKK